MFGKCKACERQEVTIALLREEINFLRGLVHSPQQINQKIQATHVEADAIMSGHTDVIELKDTDPGAEDPEVESERDRLLSGTY